MGDAQLPLGSRNTKVILSFALVYNFIYALSDEKG